MRLVFETSAETAETPGMLFPMPSDSRHAPHHRDAFTLIELLVVITIIAILAGLTLAAVGGVQQKAARSRAESEVAALSAAIDSYKLDAGDYPPMGPANNTAGVYTNLCPTGGGKVYFEPTAGMVTNGKFIDPWGADYLYKTGSAATYNVGFFDLWSTAGSTNTNAYIRN